MRPRWIATKPWLSSRCSASRIVGAAGAEHLRQLALGGQALALDELAEDDRRDDAVGDLLRGVAPIERSDPTADVGERGLSRSSRPALR